MLCTLTALFIAGGCKATVPRIPCIRLVFLSRHAVFLTITVEMHHLGQIATRFHDPLTLLLKHWPILHGL